MKRGRLFRAWLASCLPRPLRARLRGKGFYRRLLRATGTQNVRIIIGLAEHRAREAARGETAALRVLVDAQRELLVRVASLLERSEAADEADREEVRVLLRSVGGTSA